MPKEKKVTEVYSQGYYRGKVPVDLFRLRGELDKGGVSGYVIKDGQLSDGCSFCEIRLIFKPLQPNT